MDSGLPVKDVGLSVDTGLCYSEDDYQGALNFDALPLTFKIMIGGPCYGLDIY